MRGWLLTFVPRYKSSGSTGTGLVRRCAQSVPKECQISTQEHPTPTKTKGRNASKTLTFRPLFDQDKRFLSPGRLPVSPPRRMF